MDLCFGCFCRGVVLLACDVYLQLGRVDVARDQVLDAQGIGAFHQW